MSSNESIVYKNSIIFPEEKYVQTKWLFSTLSYTFANSQPFYIKYTNFYFLSSDFLSDFLSDFYQIFDVYLKTYLTLLIEIYKFS